MELIGWALIGLAVLLGLIGSILYIVLLVKLFKHGGVGLGILGIFCGFFTYIWGWVKSGQLGIKKLMVWLTLLLFITAGLAGAGSAIVAASNPELQSEWNKAKLEINKAVEEAQKNQPPR